jgi:hypothetical protein
MQLGQLNHPTIQIYRIPIEMEVHMEGNRKRFSKGWLTGLVLGTVAAGGVTVYAAVTLPHTFQNGQTADADQVNANFQALAGCPSEMIKVASFCVDTTAQVVTDTGGCSATGQGCSNIAVGSGPAVPYTWGQALAACTNAGKRLAKGSEIIAAFNTGALTVAANALLIVDAASARPNLGDLYAGTHLRLGTNGFALLGTNTPYTQAFDNWAFHCAR